MRMTALAAASAMAMMGLGSVAVAAPSATAAVDDEHLWAGEDTVEAIDELRDKADDDESVCVVAIDPGHNAEEVAVYDEETGAYMVDYPNGVELEQMWDASLAVAEALAETDIVPVVLRDDVDESVTYRERVDRAEQIDADMAISLHTTPGVNYSMVIAQEVGGYREGVDADGRHTRVEFDDADVAEMSQALAEAVAAERTEVEDNPVKVVTEHSFNGRAPLWGGNMPILSLLSDEIPWLYSELGVESGGGADGVTDDELEAYVDGVVAGVVAAVKDTDCAATIGDDEAESTDSAISARTPVKKSDARATERNRASQETKNTKERHAEARSK